VPNFRDDVAVGTLVLLGWTGGRQWPVFVVSREATDGEPHPLDRWTRRLIDTAASELGAMAFYPFGGPPYHDFQRWALRAEPVARSPIGLLIHPDWGLWHAYRGALGFRERLALPLKLTETAINKAIREATQTGRRDLADAGCPGLLLRVTPSGAASWVLACRDRQGRMRRFPLGRFPSIGISEARGEARSLHARVKHEGADPIADRRRDRSMGADARAGIGTLAAVLDLYTEKRGRSQKAWGEARKRIDLILKPLLGKPFALVVVRDIQLIVDAYPSAASASFMVRSLRPALKWAAQRGYTTEDATRLQPPAPTKRRKRVLSRDELAALLPALRATNRPYGAAFRFMLMTVNAATGNCSGSLAGFKPGSKGLDDPGN
jgi:hypothetical protein